jgi:hypothetical protein
MEEIWIIGVGRFGTSAYQRLAKAGRGRRFVLVDPAAQKIQPNKGPATSLEVADGVEYLEKCLARGRRPDWIIPALPLHLAAEWLLLHMGPTILRRVPLPAGLAKSVPNRFYGAEGNLYASHADFRCPEDCNEPRDICTITGKPRKQPMYGLLGNLQVAPFKPLNIRSHQLGPGIGGYRAEQLFEMRDKVEQITGPVLLSTACRCHGVITGIEKLSIDK